MNDLTKNIDIDSSLKQYMDLANEILKSKTKALLDKTNELLSIEDFENHVQQLPVNKKIGLLLALQRTRLDEFTTLSHLVKNLLTIVELSKKFNDAPDAKEWLGAEQYDVTIVKLLMKYSEFITIKDKKKIINILKRMIKSNINLKK